MKAINRIFLVLAMMGFLSACDPEKPPVIIDEDPTQLKDYGTLEVEFRVPGSFLPPNRILRADLSVAKSAELLYQGNFSYVANVYNSTLLYKIKLEPGDHYYQAGIVCIARGDSCSAAGFPGGMNGMKWAIGRATIIKDQTTHVVPQFTQ